MKISKLLSGAIVVVTVTIFGCKKEKTPAFNNQLNTADNNFILLVGVNHCAETATAKVAVLKSADSAVLSFATQLITEHTSAQTDLKTMGTIVGFTVKDTLDEAHAAVIRHLDSLTGRVFDSAYIHTRLAEQQAAIDFYNDEVKNGQQTNVQAYAKSILQNIQLNFQRADSIARAFY